MTTELERTLARELQEVADGLRVPPMPSVAGADDHRRGMPRLWQPMLVAAAVVLVLGLVALVLSQQGDGRPQPAPSPSPSVVRSPRPTAVADGAPTIPYVLDQRLHVDGAEVPGTWAFVESRGGVWLAQQVDGSWWTGGPGVDTGRIDAQIDQPPAISPDGRYIAFVDTSGGAAHLTGFDTQPAGEGFGQAPVELPSTEDGVALRVRAVTDDGDVIVQGTRTSLMWRALHQDQQTVVDLSRSAPGQVVLQGTPAGLVVVDGADGAVDATDTAPYLATVSPEGAAQPRGRAADVRRPRRQPGRHLAGPVAGRHPRRRGHRGGAAAGPCCRRRGRRGAPAPPRAGCSPTAAGRGRTTRTWSRCCCPATRDGRRGSAGPLQRRPRSLPADPPARSRSRGRRRSRNGRHGRHARRHGPRHAGRGGPGGGRRRPHAARRPGGHRRRRVGPAALLRRRRQRCRQAPVATTEAARRTARSTSTPTRPPSTTPSSAPAKNAYGWRITYVGVGGA